MEVDQLLSMDLFFLKDLPLSKAWTYFQQTIINGKSRAQIQIKSYILTSSEPIILVSEAETKTVTLGFLFSKILFLWKFLNMIFN